MFAVRHQFVVVVLRMLATLPLGEEPHICADRRSVWNVGYTVEPRYNEVFGTMTVTLLYQASHIRVKIQRNIKSWDQQTYLVIRGFCYFRPLYNEVPLY